MPKQRQSTEDKELSIDFGKPTEKQQKFLDSHTLYTCFGGARGGGKSHVARLKAVGLCLSYPGIRVLMIRCHYPELEENLINPILRWLPAEIYSYNGTKHLLTFTAELGGSTIKFGHYDGDAAESEYQGTEYDIIFIDEATQLSERAFQYIKTIMRGTTEGFPKRMYLTCNPGGVGHRWVKRLFVDRHYINDPKNPEANEDPKDYTMIFATVEDNPYLLENTPAYLQSLASLPEDLRRAHRYGDWDALGGNYFKGFSRGVHTMKRFSIPSHWQIYRSFDYGLDLFACMWWAVDEDGRSWGFREFEESGLIIQEAAQAVLTNTLPAEKPLITFAPPDMWNRQKDSGKTMAEIFLRNGLSIVKSDNNRVQGHMIMRDMMSPIPLKDPYVKSLFPEGTAPDKMPAFMLFDDLTRVIGDISDIQSDEKNPNDCSKQPHDVTHTVDACRYYCISRVLAAEQAKQEVDYEDDEDEGMEDYETYMCGGEATASYIGA